MSASEAYRIQVATFPREADGELVSARHDQLVPADQHRVTRENQDEGWPREATVQEEPDHRRVDHQAARPGGPRRSRSGTRRASVVPASRRSGPWRPRLGEENCGRPAVAAVGGREEHDEDGDRGEARDRQGVRVSARGAAGRLLRPSRERIVGLAAFSRRAAGASNPPPHFERIEPRRTRGTRDRAGRVTMHPRG